MIPLFENCGNTPLIPIGNGIYGKLETYNPTGSVKDRMVFYVVEKAIFSGDIDCDTVFCEATSGNTGISLSAAAAALGNRCIIYMPENMSDERKQMMTVFGAELRFSGANDFAGAIAMRDDFLKSTPAAWSPLQFSNEANIECHRTITAPEIHKDIGSDWDAFVHGSGTGGTMMGVKQYIDANELNVRTYLTAPSEPAECHGIQGINDGQNFLLDPSLVDGTYSFTTEAAISRAKQFARDTGILVGISSGANILTCEHVQAASSRALTIVTMLCDRGERYMSIY